MRGEIKDAHGEPDRHTDYALAVDRIGQLVDDGHKRDHDRDGRTHTPSGLR